MSTENRPLIDKDSPLSIRTQWARRHAIYGVKDEWNKLVSLAVGGQPDNGPGGGWGDPDDLFIHGDELRDAPLDIPQRYVGDGDQAQGPLVVKAGIIGAGAAGLFTALTLEYLNTAQSSVKFTYDILEADTTNRSGGRLYTHQFSAQPHDYFDVGAMRFPDHAIMTRVFSLFTKMNMNKSALAPNTPDPPLGSLIPYYMTNVDPASKLPQEPWRFNDVNQWGGYKTIVTAQGLDPWQFTTDLSININPDLLALKLSPNDIIVALIEPFRQQLQDDITNGTSKGWDTLMTYDGMTTTQFLSTPYPFAAPQNLPFVPPYNYDTIQWLETFNGGTNWYDQAFSETVLESLDFDYADNVNWWCILGGAQQLATNMESAVNTQSGNPGKVQYSSRVTAIAVQESMSVNVDVNGGAGNGGATNNYSCVFNTTPLGCLEHIDTTQAGLNSATRTAMRALGYGPSCKVAIKFTRPWWIHDLPPDSAVKMGGLGHSDLNIRTCVYPSYNIYDPETSTAILLCSYTWQQDAQRLGSLMGNPSDPDETQLRNLIVSDLVKLHQHSSGLTPQQLYTIINGAYQSHFAWDWYKAPNAAGAFAFFRPFQFSAMWGKMIIPSGDVVVLGEHASPHHAWVVGALESVVHGIAAWCNVNVPNHPELQDVVDVLSKDDDPSNPYVGLPLYMDVKTAQWQAILGAWTRQEMLEGREGTVVDGMRLMSVEEKGEGEGKKRRARDFVRKVMATGDSRKA